MGDTVTNHELTVVTKGSSHAAATTGDTDTCWNPTKTTPGNHENHVVSRQLGAGQTTKTFIQGQPIVTLQGVIEPMSMPAHSDTGGGVNVASNPYRLEARPTDASHDLFAEGIAVCRTTDPTTQNHANTKGIFKELTLEEKRAMEEEIQNARCTLVKVEGECGGAGTPDMSQMNVSAGSPPGHNDPIPHGRHLGFPPNSQQGAEGYYLEVLSTDIVTLRATRENAVEKAPPACSKSLHTKWVIKRSGGGEEPREEEVISQDVLVLDDSWFQVPSIDQWGIKAKGKPDVTRSQRDGIDDQVAKDNPVSNKEQKIRDRMATGDPALSQQKQQYARHRENMRQADRDQQTADQKAANKSAQSTVKLALGVAQNAAKIYYFWNYMTDPVTLEITALGCSGSKNVTLRCYPAGKFEFDLFSDKIAENVAKIRAIAALLEKVAGIFGAHGNWSFLVDPKLALSTEYKELKEDKNGLVKSQVNRSWELSIGFGKFIEYKIEFRLPLLNFFGPMGAAANLFLNAFGIEGDGYISFLLNISPKVSARWTEYDEPSIGEFSVTVKIEVAIGARARWRDIAEIYAEGYVEVTVAFTNPSIAKEYLFKCTAKGGLQLGVRAGGIASWWGFSKGFEIDYRPPDWKYSLGEGDLHFAKLS